MIHSGCDASVSRFSFAVVILVQQQQREHRHNQHLNNHAIYTTTPPSTNTPPPSSPFNAHRAATISAGRVKEAGWQQQGRGKASPARISPARISRLKLPLKFLPRESSSGSSSYWVRRGRGGASSPDWWIRGVTRPGRRNAPPFETFLETPRRGVEQGTGRGARWSEGRSPALQKGRTRRLLMLMLASLGWLVRGRMLMLLLVECCCCLSRVSVGWLVVEVLLLPVSLPSAF